MNGLPENEAVVASNFVEFKREDVESSIPARFKQQVAGYPHQIAVKSKNHQLTYKELDEAANRVAQAILTRRGEGAEPIALLLEYGVSVLIGILGVLKAGKIYVPLDDSFPNARNTYILDDSQSMVIVTDNLHLSLAKELAGHKAQVMNIDEIDPGLCSAAPDILISPDALAFILYTSGSTGQPKGLVGNHRNLLHETMVLTNSFHICPDDGISLLHSCSYFPSTWYIFTALLNGARLCPLNIIVEGTADLANWLIREEITIFSGRMFIRELSNIQNSGEGFPRLRLSLVGGDSIYAKDVDLCRKIFSDDFVMVVGFAATETGIITQYFIDKRTQVSNGVMPVGYSVEGKKVLLLDDAGNEVGFNQVGEIAVKSRYLSPGYWQRPDLTQAKFLQDPEGGDENIYLTGDIGCMLPDGCLKHLGRKDSQVKIRVFRVEIGEVEAALLNLDNIKEATVVAQEESSGDNRLVAYITWERQPAPTASVIRRSLAKKLPDYMIPSIFVVMDAMPLTPTGKIDRQKLPSPGKARPELENPFSAPQTPIEKKLTEIWAEILGLDQVGIHDNFFDLGGHSLLATQLVSRANKTFQVEVPLIAVLQSPTVANMSEIIVHSLAERVEDGDMDRILSELE